MMAKLLLLCLVVFVTLSAQTTPSLAPDDPMVYQMFFAMSDNLGTAITKKKVGDPVHGAKFESSMARLFGIGPTELASLTSKSHQLTLDLQALLVQVQAYLAKVLSLGQPRDPSVLEQFEEQRQLLILTAVNSMRLSMAADKWSNLHSYINNVYRLKITTGVLPANSGK